MPATMQATRAKIGSVMLICHALFATGVWALMTSPGAWNQFERLALTWYLSRSSDTSRQPFPFRRWNRPGRNRFFCPQVLARAHKRAGLGG